MSEMKVFRFDVDEDYAKQHNEMLRDTRSLVTSGVSLGVLAILGAVAVYFLLDPASPWHLLGSLGLLLFGVLMLIVAFLIPRSMGTAQSLYDAHPLAPAIIAERRATDLTLLALVNANADPGTPPVWAATTCVIHSLPDTPDDGDVAGTRVPVAAVGGQRSIHDKNRWQVITPMPIAWGTPDRAVVEAARSAVPREQWAMLDRAAGRLEEVQAAKNNLLIL